MSMVNTVEALLNIEVRDDMRAASRAASMMPRTPTNTVRVYYYNLIENGLGSQVIVFRLLYCLFLPITSESRLTSLLSRLPVLYLVNAKGVRVPAQIGHMSVVSMAQRSKSLPRM